ncbi:MAG TPA: response regulator [Vicinamibacterales bacterium]|nr:response regulator [Vicinamibacterales bacterium]
MTARRCRRAAVPGGSAIGARALKPEHALTPQILLVDDNPTNLQVLYQTLEGQGYRLLAAKSGRDALAIADRTVPDLIMLDVMMPDMDGFETCIRLKAGARTRESAVIFLSALTEPQDKVRGLELGAVDFVNKPFQAEEVLARVRTHLTIRDLNRQLRRRNEELEHELAVAQELLREAKDRGDGVLLGDSEAARRLCQNIVEAAQRDDLLLIAGPPGSDHEAVARAVHHQSGRATRAIICVNCLSALSDASFAPETDRELDIAEKLRLANGGTLYLEGIQHLPDASQRILARMLATVNAGDRAAQAAQSDVRVILATTRALDEEVAAGRIVQELHRAVRTTIELAPLSARLDDLPVLVRHIVQRQAEQTDRVAPRIGDTLLARLKRYRWPGNLRELRSVLELSLATSPGEELEVVDSLLDDSVKIGSYQLIDRLGSGGMGEVWLARHQLLARPAAVKLVRQEARAYGEEERRLRQRFEREAHATAELQSPHTVQLYDFGMTEAGNFYYVMERLRGMDLQRMVERYGPLEPERAVYLLKQACRSLSEAHHLGLVHRDIKPANLFVCRLGQEHDFLKVLDFGMVSRMTPAAPSQIAVAGTILGTPAFLAPELASGAGLFDARADIYALGCVAFWLLTGQPPFDANDMLAVLRHHSTTPPSPPSLLSEEPIPADLDAIVLACLSKGRESRPATVDVLWEQLDAVGFAQAWDQARARAWWEQHAPELVGS